VNDGYHTWLTLDRTPAPIPADSLLTYITGVSPVASVNIPTLEEEGEEGLSEPAAKTPDDVSEENAKEEIMP
jgi:hypothetical protein